MSSDGRTYAFDLDGVLIDTRKANKAAYVAAGVEYPLGAYGRSWQEWLPDACKRAGKDVDVVRDLKAKWYPSALRSYAVHLPLANVIHPIHELHDVTIVTSGSKSNAQSALDFLGIQGIDWACNLSSNERVAWLDAFSPGVYFDDRDDLFSQLLATGWTTCLVTPPSS
jgi:phosphoglycolate phosphatase-like HAD superfamily hydrolase